MNSVENQQYRWESLPDYFFYTPDGPPFYSIWRNGKRQTWDPEKLVRFFQKQYPDYILPESLHAAKQAIDDRAEASWIKLGHGFAYSEGALESMPPQFVIRVDGEVLYGVSCAYAIGIMHERGLDVPEMFHE